MGVFSNNSGKKLAKGQIGGASLIGKGTTFKGEIITEVDLNINGVFEGNVNSSSDVYIGEEGKINGKVNSKALFINGLIEGEIEAERVEIGSKGKAIANIISEYFIIFAIHQLQLFTHPITTSHRMSRSKGNLS